jgi:hypothetical protein
MNKTCYSCNKPGHFPHSQNCKAKRREKQKEKLADKCSKLKLNCNELKANIKTEIFCKCFQTHVPQQKFCCCAESKLKPPQFPLKPTLLEMLQSRIQLIKNDYHNPDYEKDQLTSPLRLRGGGS